MTNYYTKSSLTFVEPCKTRTITEGDFVKIIFKNGKTVNGQVSLIALDTIMLDWNTIEHKYFDIENIELED